MSKPDQNDVLAKAFHLFDDLNEEDPDTQPIDQHVPHFEFMKGPSSSSSPSELSHDPSEEMEKKKGSLVAVVSNEPLMKDCVYPFFSLDNVPVQLGPIEYIDQLAVGGGRGYVARRDISAGTLLLEERAFLTWPGEVQQEHLFLMTLEKLLFSDSDSDELFSTTHAIAQLQHLHPRKLEDLPAEVLQDARDRYEKYLHQIQDRYTTYREKRKDGDHQCLSVDQLLQLVLAMQCNAFHSGVFLHSAMFNHSCNPNGVKIKVQDTTEVRASRDIEKGEAVTISYLFPLMQSYVSRQLQLKKQFGFQCHCSRCGEHEQGKTTELQVTNTLTIETQLTHMEDSISTMSYKDTQSALSQSLELLSDLLEMLPHHDIVFSRVHKLIADCCAKLLLKKMSREQIMILFLQSNFELLDLQLEFLNPDHLDLATTYNDLSQGIQMLLSCNPQVLHEEFPEWKDFKAASHAENKYRKEHMRIKKLYQ